MAARKYRVITKCWGGHGEPYVHIETDWKTRSECRKYILGRWRESPPWAFVSSIDDYDKLQKRYG